MPKVGFEPTILSELRPERSVYTSFTTSARFLIEVLKSYRAKHVKYLAKQDRQTFPFISF